MEEEVGRRRVVASSANWEELKPWGTLAGFRWSLIPAVESHTGGNTTLGKTYVMYHLGIESETVEARVAVDGRGVMMSAEALGRFRGGGRGWKATQRTFRTHPAKPTWHTWGILHAARQIQVSCTFCTWCKCSHTLPVETSKIKIARFNIKQKLPDDVSCVDIFSQIVHFPKKHT